MPNLSAPPPASNAFAAPPPATTVFSAPFMPASAPLPVPAPRSNLAPLPVPAPRSYVTPQPVPAPQPISAISAPARAAPQLISSILAPARAAPSPPPFASAPKSHHTRVLTPVTLSSKTAPISIKLAPNRNLTEIVHSPQPKGGDEKPNNFWSWLAGKEAEEDASNTPASAASPVASAVKVSPALSPAPPAPTKSLTPPSFKSVASASSCSSSKTSFSPANTFDISSCAGSEKI